MRIVFKYTDNLSVVLSRFRYAAKKKLLTRIKREKRIPVKNVETEGDTEKKASTERRLQPSFCFALCHVRFLSRGLPNIDYISVPNSNVDMDFKTRGNLEASWSFILNLLLATNALNFWQFVWKMTYNLIVWDLGCPKIGLFGKAVHFSRIQLVTTVKKQDQDRREKLFNYRARGVVQRVVNEELWPSVVKHKTLGWTKATTVV